MRDCALLKAENFKSLDTIENWDAKKFALIVTFDGSHRDHSLGWYRGRIVHESEEGRRFVTIKESLEIYASIFDAPSNPDAHYGDGKDYVKWLRMAAAAIR